MIVDDIIRSALTELGVIPTGEAITPEWNTMALNKLNAMLQDWAAEGLKLHALTTNSVTLTPTVAAYTIGTGGTFAVRRPVELVDAVLTVKIGQFRPLKVFNTLFRYRGYGSYPLGIPSEVYFDPQFSLGRIVFYPSPDSAYAVDLISLVSLVSFAASTETIPLPPEYENPLSLNLAMRLMSTFGKTDELVMKNAQRAEGTLFTNNSKRLIPDNVPLDSMLRQDSLWNITTGSF